MQNCEMNANNEGRVANVSFNPSRQVPSMPISSSKVDYKVLIKCVDKVTNGKLQARFRPIRNNRRCRHNNLVTTVNRLSYFLEELNRRSCVKDVHRIHSGFRVSSL